MMKLHGFLRFHSENCVHNIKKHEDTDTKDNIFVINNTTITCICNEMIPTNIIYYDEDMDEEDIKKMKKEIGDNNNNISNNNNNQIQIEENDWYNFINM